MAALLVGAFAVAARGLRGGRLGHAVAAGALLGAAFETKLFEALMAALPLALLWWCGAAASRRQRLGGGAAAIAACLCVGLAWLVVVTATVPAAQRPWAFGSSNGSAWNAAFVYDGWDRLTGASAPGMPLRAPSRKAAARVPAGPGPMRLFSARDHLGRRIGVELAAAWAALVLLAATRGWRGLDRAGRAGLASLATWLALGTVLFSVQGALRPRYLEAFDPAIAACLGAGAVLGAAALRRRTGGALVAVAVGCALAASALTSIGAVSAHVQDSGSVGALPAQRVERLSAYLRAHQHGARYEFASVAASPAAPVIVRDARPVLVLTAAGRPVVSLTRLRQTVAAGALGHVLVSDRCQVAGCTPARALDPGERPRRQPGRRRAAPGSALRPGSRAMSAVAHAPRARTTPAVASVAAAGSLLVALGASAWLVLAAAERPSVLSPPTLRVAHRWLLGPLSGVLPHLTSDPTRLRVDETIALVVLFAAWLAAWACASALPLRAVAVAVALAQLVFALGPPQPLTDTFNYIVYGRMAAHGINPYTHAPLAAPHDAAYALSNWHHLPSPYGPLFTLLSEPLGLLGLPVAYWSWKLIVVACALASLALVAWLARRLGRSPQRALACAGLCPLTLAVGIGGFHNDMPAVLCVLAAAACLLKGGRLDAAAGALAIAAAGLKPSFAVVAPLLVLGANRRLLAAAGAAAAAAVVGVVVLLAFGGALPAVGLQDRLVNPLSVPNLVGVLAGHGGADAAIRSAGRIALLVVVLGAVALVAWRRAWALPAVGVVLLASVVSLSWVMPWYLAWSLPFAALARPRVLAPLAVLVCLWLGVAGSPQMPQLVHAIGWYPTRSATGHVNHEFSVGLVR